MGVGIFIIRDSDVEIESVYSDIDYLDISSRNSLLESINVDADLSLIKLNRDEYEVYLVIQLSSFYKVFTNKINEKVHEIKNLLTVVVSSAMLIMKLKNKGKLLEKEEQIGRYLTDIDISIQSIIVQLNALKNILLNKEKEYTISILDFIKFTKSSCKSLCLENKVELIFNEKGEFNRSELISLKGIAFNQLTLNLVKNSIYSLKKANNGKPKIEICVERINNMLSLSIQDNGLGVEADIKEKIFEEGFSTKGNEGSGIGLFLCQSSVEKSGGNLELDDSVVNGAKFIFSVPIK